MKRAFLYLSLLAGCGGGADDLGQVHYNLVEWTLASGWAGSCLPRFSGVDYSDNYDSLFRNLKWAVGADLNIGVTWPDRTDCHASGGERVCPPVNATFASLGVWGIYFTSANPAQSFGLGLRANAEGEGGFKAVVAGKDLDPRVWLKVVRPTAIQFQRSRGPYFADLIDGPITEIHVARGAEVIVTATLRDAAGAKVCGALPATATIDPPGGFFVQTIQGPYLNLPYRIYGNAPGRGTFEVQSGDLRAALTVIVD